MKILSLIELNSLSNLSEEALNILTTIISNEELRDKIQYAKPIRLDITLKGEILHCQILFVESINDPTKIRPIVIHEKNKISGGGKSYCEAYKAYALDNGGTYFIKSFKQAEGSEVEYENEVFSLRQLGRLNGQLKTGNIKYLMTNFIQGMSLVEFKQQFSPTEPEHFWQFVTLFISASARVSQLHSLGFIHRDIKPANLMVDSDLQCHLVDFGGCSVDQSEKPEEWGTAGYLAPEISEGNPFLLFTKETDLFALGKTFNEIYQLFEQKFKLITIGKNNKHLSGLFNQIDTLIRGLMDCRSKRLDNFYEISQLQIIPRSFHSKPEAFTYTIMLLTQWQQHYVANHEVSSQLHGLINEIKTFYENHEQDVSKVIALLNPKNFENFNASHQNLLSILTHVFTHIKPPAPYDDILPRRFESDFAQALIQSPTSKMMESIGQVSLAIVKILEKTSEDDPIINKFIHSLTNCTILFGSPQKILTLNDIIEILRENNPIHFIKIQHIAFKFSQEALRELALDDLPTGEPNEYFAHMLGCYQKKYPDTISEGESLGNFYRRMAVIEGKKGSNAYRFRAFICDELFYGHSLFQYEATRGRFGAPNTELKTNQVGLMTFEQEAHANGLLRLPDQAWYADCKTQKADKKSIHYTSAVESDCPYVCGTSGMTSLYINMMFLLLNPQDHETIFAYSLGIMAYLVGAGYHSIKEILLPLVYCIRLFPDYPKNDRDSELMLKAPALYNLYFRSIEQIDKEFQIIHQQIWTNHLTYFADIYMPLGMREFCLPAQIEKVVISEDATEMSNLIEQSVIDCTHQERRFSSSSSARFFSSVSTVEPKFIILESLNAICKEQISFISIVRSIQSFYGMSKDPEVWEPFIRCLLDKLKESPTLLSHLNLRINSSTTISCSDNFNLTLKLLLASSLSSKNIDELERHEESLSTVHKTILLGMRPEESVAHEDGFSRNTRSSS